MAVAFAAVLLLPPHVRRGHYVKCPLPLWVVRVCEVDPPKGVKPLEWILLTNVPVATRADSSTHQLIPTSIGSRVSWKKRLS